jgi:hypothetical protein
VGVGPFSAIVGLVIVLSAAGTTHLSSQADSGTSGGLSDWEGYEFVCPSENSSLTPVNVLEASGNHQLFLELLKEHDPEGLSILSDPKLADKTVWAPVDSAIQESTKALTLLDSAGIKKVLGYHVSPPRRSPFGEYPIVTPGFIAKAEAIENRTRTGVLTGSDQRTLTKRIGMDLFVEEVLILATSWCTAAGSVFSIDGVILDVVSPGFLEKNYNRMIRILFYDDSRFIIWPTAGAFMLGQVVFLILRKLKRRDA